MVLSNFVHGEGSQHPNPSNPEGFGTPASFRRSLGGVWCREERLATRQGIVLKKSLAFSTPILLEGRRRNTQWREFLSVYSVA